MCLDWIGHRDLSRAQVREILHGTLLGALGAAAHGDGDGSRRPA
jgi:hypothetical protein